VFGSVPFNVSESLYSVLELPFTLHFDLVDRPNPPVRLSTHVTVYRDSKEKKKVGDVNSLPCRTAQDYYHG
jgi:hypothetical protein